MRFMWDKSRSLICRCKKEFEFGTTKTAKRVDYASASEGGSVATETDVYDVVLAGVLEG